MAEVKKIQTRTGILGKLDLMSRGEFKELSDLEQKALFLDARVQKVINTSNEAYAILEKFIDLYKPDIRSNRSKASELLRLKKTANDDELCEIEAKKSELFKYIDFGSGLVNKTYSEELGEDFLKFNILKEKAEVLQLKVRKAISSYLPKVLSDKGLKSIPNYFSLSKKFLGVKKNDYYSCDFFEKREYLSLSDELGVNNDVKLTLVLPQIEYYYKNNYSNDELLGVQEINWKYVTIQNSENNKLEQVIALPISSSSKDKSLIGGNHENIVALAEKISGKTYCGKGAHLKDYNIRGGHLKFVNGSIVAYDRSEKFGPGDNALVGDLFNQLLMNYKEKVLEHCDKTNNDLLKKVINGEENVSFFNSF